MSVLRRQQPTLILIAALIVVIPLAQSDAVLLDTSTTIAIYGLIALSVGMTWGQTGLLSVAQAAFAALGAYATAIATTEWGWPPLLGLLLAITVPALVGYLVARALARLAALALAIATLALGEILYEVLQQGGDLTGGYIGISGIPVLGFASDPLAFNILAWGLVALVVALYSNLVGSARGRALRTIRSDRIRAAADGINTPHVLSTLFAASAAVAGLGGWLYAHYLTYMAPESLSTTLSISVLLMAIAGGAATVLGPLVGATLLTLSQNTLPAEEAQGLFYGLAVVLVLLLAPRGILGTRWRLPRRRIGGDSGEGGGGLPPPRRWSGPRSAEPGSAGGRRHP